MTEEEWQSTWHSFNMMRFIDRNVTSRKGDLFGSACCWQLDPVLSDKTRFLLLSIEQRADDLSAEVNDEAIEDALRTDRDAAGSAHEAAFDAASLAVCWYWAAHPDPDGDAEAEADPAFRETLAGQSELVRDIFGNPFRPVVFPPSWRSEMVVLLAQGIYNERAFDRLPILADALEEAGCDHADVLTHCRESNGVHARGCWVVDGVLGK